MMSKRPVVAIATVVCFVMPWLAVIGGDAPSDSGWPQYRGVLRDGTEPAPQAAVSWPEAGPGVVWRVPLGSAFSQAAVHGDAIYTGTSDDESEYLVRLDAATGKQIWRSKVGPVFAHDFGNGPRATPTLDGDSVYLLGANGTLISAAASDGAISWRVNLTERFGANAPRFGYSGSPLVADDLLMIEVGGKDEAWVAALDKSTGETKWTALSGPAGYSSPLLTEIGGVRQVVMERGKTVTALDLNGTVLWTYELEEAAIAMPLDVGGDRVFVSSSGDTGCVMLRVAKGEDGFSVDELWKNRNMRNHFNSSVIVRDHLYGFDNATLKCLSVETGELMWAKRGFGKGSIAVAGGQIFVLGDNGQFALVQATPEEYRESGAMQALEGKSWTAPSYADGRLYLRNLSEMTCLRFKG